MSATDPLIGKKLGDYLIEGIQGTGGMARVYRGYDDKLDRYAAVKVIEPQLIASAEEDEYRERFLREARAIARLSHPRIVGIYQFGQMENLYYIAMEYIEGRNLREILKGYAKQDKFMPLSDALSSLKDIASALDYAHRQSIIHRDVKPSNIIVNTEGHAILTDFGLALNAIEGTIGNTFGSVHYIAPEQAISSAQAVPASDQYSLGIITYEMFTGRVPFDDNSAMSVALKHISDPPPPLREINPDIPPQVERVVMRALDKDVHKRFTLCMDFVQALEAAYSVVDEQPTSVKSRVIPQINTETSTQTPPPVMIDDAPTLKDTSSKAASIMRDSKTTSGNTTQMSSTSESGRSGGRAGWLVAAVLLIILIIGAVAFLPSLLPQPPDTSGTATVNAEETLALLALNETATTEAEVILAVNATAEARLTETAQVNASETRLAQLAEIALHQTETSDAQVAQAVEATANARDTQTQAAALSATPPGSTPTTATAMTITSENLTSTTQIILSVTAVAQAAIDETASVEPLDTPTTPAPTATPTHTASMAPSLTDTAAPTLADTVAPAETPLDVSPTSETAVTPATPVPINDVTQTATLTPTPGLEMLNNESAQLLLAYTYDSLVIYNRDERLNVPYVNIEFHLFEPDATGEFEETGVYRIITQVNDTRGLAPARCFQVWSSEFSLLPEDEPPADICQSRSAFVSTVNVAWASENPKAYFEVRWGRITLLTTCPAATPDIAEPLRCLVDIG